MKRTRLHRLVSAPEIVVVDLADHALHALRLALLDPSTGMIDPARIAIDGRTPAFNLAILDCAGESGLIGRGVYHPPAELFAAGSA